MTKHDIFLSYSRRDAGIMQQVKNIFRSHGLTVWTDEGISPGTPDWQEAIEVALANSANLVCLLSPEAKKSKWVRAELWRAQQQNVPIYPILIRGTELQAIPLGYEHYQWIDLRKKSPDDLAQGLNDLIKQFTRSKLVKYQASVTPSDSADVKVKSEASKISVSAESIRAIIGAPFDLCEIPAGDFIYGEGETERSMSLSTFYMAKYPVTYSQYQVFVDAKYGLQDRRWWEGLAQAQNDLGDQQWKIADHPRENVNWYDALAFCRWLSWKLGGEYKVDKLSEWLVRLPTEFEWEKAARGTDGRIYPYEGKFDASKGNTRESGIGKTSLVTKYPQGASPDGVLDMSGNVWEWCLSEHINPTEHLHDENISFASHRVLRGGSWFYNFNFARAASRNDNYPLNRLNFIGFRVLHPPSL